MQRRSLGFGASFTHAETKQLLRGWVPDPVVDWWFICVEDGWINFHRCDTGFCIYALRLDYTAHGSTVAASRLNADPRQYVTRDIDYDRKLLGYLIDALLLEKRDTPFPMPADAGDATPDEVSDDGCWSRRPPHRRAAARIRDWSRGDTLLQGFSRPAFRHGSAAPAQSARHRPVSTRTPGSRTAPERRRTPA